MNCLRKQWRREDGAIALMTLAFMLTVGILSITFLWSLALITGAYNALYVANQNAAVAAASAAQRPAGTGPGGVSSGSSQLEYPCNQATTAAFGGMCVASHDSPNSAVARVSPALLAARTVMRESLSDRPFGLNFAAGADRNVAMISRLALNLNPEGIDNIESRADAIELFNMTRSAGEVRRILRQPGAECLMSPILGWGYIPQQYSGDPFGGVFHCWQLEENGITFPKNYNSGVVTRAVADIELLPGCGLAVCRAQIVVSAGASQEQIAAVNNYSQYYSYRP